MSSHILSLVRPFYNVARPRISAAFQTATGFIDNRIPAFVPRDRTTKTLIGIGASAYLADIWDPVPIGETIAISFAAIATARGVYLKNASDSPIQVTNFHLL
jgi:hypothetical protein